MLTMLMDSWKEEIHVPITTTTAIISKELSNFKMTDIQIYTHIYIYKLERQQRKI